MAKTKSKIEVADICDIIETHYSFEECVKVHDFLTSKIKQEAAIKIEHGDEAKKVLEKLTNGK